MSLVVVCHKYSAQIPLKEAYKDFGRVMQRFLAMCSAKFEVNVTTSEACLGVTQQAR